MEKTDAIKLLAIDDKPDNLTTLRAVVREALPQTFVLTATHGPTGIEMAAAEDPDVILLDIIMPGMDGFEVCRRLKADDRIKDIPVVFLTALKTDSASRVKALEAGGEGFLAKPLETVELTAQIRAMTKVKAANRSLRTEKTRLEALVAERTADLRGTLASLRESEERYRGLVANLEAGVVIHAPDTSVILNNTKASELMGLSDEQMRGTLATDPKWKFIKNNGKPCLIEDYPVNQIARHGRAIRDVVFGIERSSPHDVVWVSVNGIPVLDREGQISEIVISFIDISERKQAEDELRAGKELLAETERIGKVGGWSFNIDTMVQAWTDEVYRIHEVEISPHPSVEKGINYYTKESQPIIKKAVQRAITYGEAFDLELEIITAKGNTRAVHTIGKADLQNRRIYGFFQDITERKLAEEEREKLQAQLTLAQKMESVGRLAGGVAHDFNNLLMGIMGYAELCREKLPVDHPVREWVGEITKEAVRSANLTRQLLAFARKQTVAPQVLDLNDTVGNMLKMLRRLIGEDIDLSWQPGAELWSVKIDPGQVDQILANLCVNARDAIGGAGRISIETNNVTIHADYCAEHIEAAAGSYVMLAVSDDGCGMDRETLNKVFEPFFTTKPTGEGTGLGLATVYGIIKQNNGFINVYSEPGKGTTFRIHLPRDTRVSHDVAEAAKKTASLNGTETILLVEDETAIRTIMCLILEKLGYTVIPAESPAEALRLAEAHRDGIDLMITDVVMPGMSGRELVEKLAPDFPSMKILYMSGYTADVIAHRGVLDEGVHFLGKPVGREELAQKVRDVLG